MAVTTQNSTEYGNLIALPPVFNPTTSWKGVKRIMRFSFTQSGAGDANSLVNLARLPAGNIRVLLTECFMHNSDFGTGITLDIGWTAYTEPDGTAKAADADAFVDGLDVATAAAAALWSASSQGSGSGVTLDKTFLLSSRAGILVQAIVLGAGGIPDGATLTGFMTYVQD